jgi:capsular polysaccharide biosynthesis protein
MVTAYAQSPPTEDERPGRGEENDGEAESTYDPGLSQATVLTVARLAESTRIGQATSVQAGLRASEVVGHIRAGYEPGVQIITLTTDAPTAHKAAAIANAASTVLRQQVASGELLGRRGTLYAQPLDRATPPETPTTPKPLLNLLLGGLLGLFAGIGFLSLRNTLDDTMRSTDQIEGELQVGILATLPQVRRRHRRDGAVPALRRKQVAASVRAAVAALAPLTDTPDRRILVTSAH